MNNMTNKEIMGKFELIFKAKKQKYLEYQEELKKIKVIPITNSVLGFLDELLKRGVILKWEKLHGSDDEYLIQFNITNFNKYIK